ncbi:MAG: response regulator [Gammaproteobacteria bacterium]|nr:response regulator [Gammaproteobacteria bacterium]
MNAQETSVKHSALGWVKNSIDDNLLEIKTDLKLYIENGDAALLAAVKQRLGLIQGVLVMIEQYGAAMLTEEMVALVDFIVAGKQEQGEPALEVLLRAVLQLPDYLEHIQSGNRDIPIAILPLLNDIRAVRNQDLFSEKLLFLPDLSMHEAEAEIEAIDDDHNQASRLLAKKLRPTYQLALLNVIRDKSVEESLKRLEKVCEILEERSVSEQIARIWWIVGALLESVSRQQLELGVSIKSLLGKVDAIFRVILIVGEGGLLKRQPIELIKNFLYYIAQPECDGPKAQAIKTAYRLEQFLPSESARSEVLDNIAGPNQALLKTVAEAMRADIETVKSTLEVYVNGDLSQVDALKDLPQEMHIISDTLAMIGLGSQRQLIEGQIKVVKEIRNGERTPDEEQLLSMAAELLQVEQALDQMQKRQPGSAQQPRTESDVSRDYEMDSVLSAVVTAALDDIQKTKNAILEFVKDSGRSDNIELCITLMKESRGALLLLNQQRAVAVVDGLQIYLNGYDVTEFMESSRLDALSQVVASLEYYLEALGEHRSDASSILDLADVQLQELLASVHVGSDIEESEVTPGDEIDVSAAAIETSGPLELVDDAAPEPDSQRPEAAAVQESEPDAESRTGTDTALPVDRGATIEVTEVAAETDSRVEAETADTDTVLDVPADRAASASSDTGFDEAEKASPLVSERLEVVPVDEDLEVLKSDSDAEILEIYLEEAEEEAANIARLQRDWMLHPEDENSLKSIRRAFHTIKGSGRLVGATKIGEFAWDYEQLLNQVIDRTIPPGRQVIDAVGGAARALPELVHELKTFEEPQADIAYLRGLARALAEFRTEELLVDHTQTLSMVESPYDHITDSDEGVEDESEATDFGFGATTHALPSENLDVDLLGDVEPDTMRVEPSALALAQPEDTTKDDDEAEFDSDSEFDAGTVLVEAPPIPVIDPSRLIDPEADLKIAEAARARAETKYESAVDYSRPSNRAQDTDVGTSEDSQPEGDEPLASTAIEIETMGEDFIGDAYDTGEIGVELSLKAETEEFEIESFPEQEVAEIELPPAEEAKTKEIEVQALESEAEEIEVHALESEAEEIEVQALESEAEEIEMQALESEAEESGMQVLESEPEENGMQVLESEPEEIELQALESETEEIELQTLESEAEENELQTPESEAEEVELQPSESVEEEVAAESPPIQPQRGAPPDPFPVMTGSLEPGDKVEPGGLRDPGRPEPTGLSFDPELLTIYQQEVEQHLGIVSSALDHAEKIRELIPGEGIYRALHTINGASRTADITTIGELAALLEKPLKSAIAQTMALDHEIVALYREGQRALHQMTSELVATREMPAIPEDLRISLVALAEDFEEYTVDLTKDESGHSGDFIDTLTMMNEVGDGEQDSELLTIFVDEANELLEMSDNTLHQWSQQNSDEPAAHDYNAVMELQRYLHTLKGGARMAGLREISDLSHEMESMFIAVIDGRVDKNDNLVELLKDCFDLLHQQVVEAQEEKEMSSSAAMVELLKEVRLGEDGSHRIPDQDDSMGLDMDSEDIDIVSENLSGVPLSGADSSTQDVIKVRSDLLDNLVSSAGEVSIYRARMEQQVAGIGSHLGELGQTIVRLKAQLRNLEAETDAQIYFSHRTEAGKTGEFDPLEMDRYTMIQELSRSLSESVNDLSSLQGMLGEQVKDSETLLLQQSRVSTDLQDGLIKSRMVKFSGLLSRLRRLVRQSSQELGKKTELVVSGEQNEVDNKVLDRMVAPLEHIIRNALSHGIETPFERVKKGKPENGRIAIDITRDGSDVVIRVSDDGAGIDIEKVRSRAIQLGLLDKGHETSDADLVQYILESGFSTAEHVTQLSGRGVGMDVVDIEVKQLGGTLQIESTPQGTTFVARLPFTLSINQAILVRTGDEIYAIPLLNIEGITRIDALQLNAHYREEAPELEYAGQSFALHNLAKLVGAEAQFRIGADDEKQAVILSRAGDIRIALHVDEIIGNREIVVKTLGKQLSQVKSLAGASILADGSMVLILDVGGLIRHKVSSAVKIVYQAAEEATRLRDTVMVVDDSITMRRVASKLLERHNYEVITAKDGVDALAQLQDVHPDVMLLDIEMPRMDGFELVTHMRNETGFSSIPIIMITSRTGEKHRDRAFKIGVTNYMGKPYQEDELIQNIQSALGGR